MATNMNGINFIDANQEITQKVENYFKKNGFKSKCPERDVQSWGLPTDCDHNYYVEGTLDNVIVTIAYNDYRPKHIVRREVLALDARIADVRVFRFLTDEALHEQLFELLDESFIVVIDGEYQRVTLSDYAYYKVRNIDYTKRKK